MNDLIRKGRAAVPVMLLLFIGIWSLTGCGAAAPDAAAAPAPTPEAETEALQTEFSPGYFVCEDGLFHPARAVTETELAGILTAETGTEVTGAEEKLTAAVLRTMLTETLGGEAAARGMRFLFPADDTVVDRASAAVCLNRAFGLETDAGNSYYPDVSPDYWAYEDILTAASCASPLGTRKRPLPAGPLLVDCELYWVGEDGYALRNAWHGSLYFENDGRYSSGSKKLDKKVTEVLRSLYEPGMDREELLKAVYDYTRDEYTYLVRNYYKPGDNHLALNEALTMYSTGKGNCYNYAAAFWAAARALGWEARLISGTYGEDEAPHGWVEIFGEEDGERYTYDVEIEMKSHLQGNVNMSMFALTTWQRSPHYYMEYNFVDDFVPRETYRTGLWGEVVE